MLSTPLLSRKKKKMGELETNNNNNNNTPSPTLYSLSSSSSSSLILLYLLLLHHLLFQCSRAQAENIPLGVVFDHGSSEVQSAFKAALMSFNQLNITYESSTGSNIQKSYGFNAYVDTINTADAFKLSNIICNQFFRGVYLIIGFMNSESFETFHTYANTFEMPIITPWFPTSLIKVSKYKIRQSLYSNPALRMDLVNDTSSTSSSIVRSPLINETIQKRLDSLQEGGDGDPLSGEKRTALLDQLVDELAQREETRVDFATRIRPDLGPALLDTITHYGWTNLIYLYNSNEGLLRVQTVFQRIGMKNDSVRITVLRRISGAEDALSILKHLEIAQRFEPKHIVLDCEVELAKSIIVSHVRDVHLGRRTYHYVIAGLAFDEPWNSSMVEFSAVNITGFRIIDPERKHVQEFLSMWSNLEKDQFQGAGKDTISSSAAFMYDGIHVIKEAFSQILKDHPSLLRKNNNNSNPSRKLSCNNVGRGDPLTGKVNPFEYGKLINRYLRMVQTEGLSGHIEFKDGSRSNFTVDVMEVGITGGVNKVGTWSDIHGYISGNTKLKEMAPLGPDPNKVYIVTSILEEPYLSLKKAEKGENLTLNERYEGFCKDMADLIAKNMNIKYEIRLVKDNKYGAENPAADGGWDGMIGELIRHDADMAIAPLTITAQRETVIDFSMDFMELGISIMIKKPQIAMPGAFSFVNPMQGIVWFAALAALVSVAVVLLIVQRKPTNVRIYTLPNTLWFTIASIFRQSTPASPRITKNYTFLILFLFLSVLEHPRTEADMSLAGMTITAERERVVDFTKPYLNLGISIMIYKPKKANSGVFGFLSPLSLNTWYCVILAYFGVSLILYFVTKYNVYEWVEDACRPDVVVHQFSVPNALWFSLAALFQQGSDISPRSIAGRVVGSVWWFFTLILISSYTANFAAVRTVNRMVLPVKNAKDLSEQTSIRYGTLLGGSTFEFFRRSEVPVYKRMFEFMTGPHSLNVNHYDVGIKLVKEMKGKFALLIESPKNDYMNQRKPCDTMKVGPNLDSKGFGIGTPLGSPLKHQLNLEVLRLKENGLLNKLENKWWFERSECDVSNKQETASGDEELSLGSLAGIFYILIFGLVVAMFVSFLEFCYNSKKEAEKSKLSLAEAMKKKARHTILPTGGSFMGGAGGSLTTPTYNAH